MKGKRMIPTKTYKGYLIDLDGTMYRGNEPLPYAHAFVHELKEKKIPFLFLTNNSTTSPEDVAERLRTQFNIEATSKDVYTSALAAASYIQEKKGETAYVLGEEGLKKAVQQVGVNLQEKNPEYVIVGLHRSVTYLDFEKAVLAIHEGAEFVLTNGDANYPTERGLLPGAGSLGALVELAGKKQPVITGKPERMMMASALDKLNLKKEEVLMVGDNLQTDILAGTSNGIDTLFVLTGVSKEEDIETFNISPTYTVNNLGEWVIE